MQPLQPTPAISVQSLTKRFGDFTAVRDVTFQVRRGEIFGFLGPNGSGKTTTIRLMLGLLRPTSGEVTVLDESVTRHPERIRPRVGYMSQRFSLYNDLTVLENLQFYGRAYGLKNDVLHERIRMALELSDLVGRERVRTRDLSGGWRQRLALSAAILHRPEVIFLDEPTAGVDPISRRLFWDLLYRLAADGVTVFVTTHYMDEAERCHRLAFIQRGRLIAQGTPDEIKTRMMPGVVLELAPPRPADVVRALRASAEAGALPIHEVTLYGALVHVIADPAPDIADRLRAALRRADLEPGSIEVIAPSLEDVFISCMGAASGMPAEPDAAKGEAT